MKKIYVIIAFILFNVMHSQNCLCNTNHKPTSMKEYKNSCDKCKIENQQIVEINPFGVDKIVTKIKKNNSIKFKINNVNTFKIKGITESTVQNRRYEIPDIFDNYLKNNDTYLVESDSISNSISDSIDYLINDSINHSVNDSVNYSIIVVYSKFIQKYHQLQQQIELESKLLNLIKDSIFIENPEILKLNSSEYYHSVYPNETITESRGEVNKTINSIFILYNELIHLFKKVNQSEVSFTNKITDSSEMELSYDDIILKIEPIKKFVDEITFAKNVVDELSDDKKRNEWISRAQSGIDWYNKINNASFTYYTDGEQINDDEVTITPKLKDNKGNVVHEFKPIKISSYGGIKIDFSAGYLLSFIGNDNFTMYKDSTTMVKGIKSSNKDIVNHSLGGLIHVYSNNSNNFFDYGGSVGASLGTNGNLGFYLGGSAFFLEKNRLVLTLGCSFVKVNKLNTSNLLSVEEDIYQFINFDDLEIRYDQVYRGAMFLGITYNISH